MSFRRVGDPLKAACLALILGAYAIRVGLVRRHAFDPDEFQHLHGAWSIANGILPYRDYFEHHTPWLHFFLAAFVGSFAVETSARSAEAFVFFARALMCFFSALALALTFRLGRALAGDRMAWVATAILSLTVMFLDKTLEIRPDVPGVAFLLGSWLALLGALESPPGHRRTRALLAGSGWLLGTALLCTQKILFTLPATFLLLAIHATGRRSPDSGRLRRARWADVFVHTAAVAAPIGIVLAVFAVADGASAFIESNLLVNARWKANVGPGPALHRIWSESPLTVVFGLAGWAALAFGWIRQGRSSDAAALCVMQAAALAVGAFVIPVAYAQYFVMLLPVLALLAAHALLAASDAVGNAAGKGPVFASGVATAFVVVLAAGPVRAMAALLDPPHTKVRDHLATLAHVVESTPPEATFMDGFSGLGVFRPHAYRYFFLHDEVRALLAGAPLGRLLGQLRDGTVSPSYVVLDGDVLGLPADIVAFVKENYEPAAVPPLWQRRQIWLDDPSWAGRVDLGGAGTDVLAGHGWYRPERDDDRTFRQGRGPRSSVRLPLRNAEACRSLTIRVRLQYAAAAPRMQVSLNGSSLGVLPLTAGWQDRDVALPPGVAHRGMNTLQLAYDPVPRSMDPAHQGRNALVAVDEIIVRCDALPSGG